MGHKVYCYTARHGARDSDNVDTVLPCPSRVLGVPMHDATTWIYGMTILYEFLVVVYMCPESGCDPGPPVLNGGLPAIFMNRIHRFMNIRESHGGTTGIYYVRWVTNSPALRSV